MKTNPPLNSARNILFTAKLFLFSILVAALPANADIPNLINYQARLTDHNGQAVTGNRSMVVKIYDSPSGGNLTYEENIGNVYVDNGTYSFKFGSGGSEVVSANETIVTTNGTNQIFNGSLTGNPAGGNISITDGVYYWDSSSLSSNPSEFQVTFNSIDKTFQVIYFTQVPLAGRAIVATYQKLETNTVVASLEAEGAYFALSVNGTEESVRTRLLTVPYALKSLKSETSADTQMLAPLVESTQQQILSLSNNITSLSGNLSSINSQIEALSPNVTLLQSQFPSMTSNVTNMQSSLQEITTTLSEIHSRFRVIELTGNMSFGDSTMSNVLKISNKGFDHLEVYGIQLPSGFSGNWSGTIPPNSEQEVTISFQPTEVQSYSGNISINSNATGGEDQIFCSGEGARKISMSGDLDFGNFPVNISNFKSLTIKNSGTLPVQILSINYPPGFSGNWPGGTIEPMANQIVNLKFLPAASQSYNGNITIYSNSNSANQTKSVQGNGLSYMVNVAGGVLPPSSSFAGTTVAPIFIGRFEVTLSEWNEVIEWSVQNNMGYDDLVGVGVGANLSHPVRQVSWYDVLKWCNAKSQRDGFTPVYTTNGTIYRSGVFGVNGTVNYSASGYRLPTQSEWEWAARGGSLSQGYIYSGSNNMDLVGWYNLNSLGAEEPDENGRGTWPVGKKSPNELGIYDMSGNVWEWTMDLMVQGAPNRQVRGGSFAWQDSWSAVSFAGNWLPDFRSNDGGFRLVRKQ